MLELTDVATRKLTEVLESSGNPDSPVRIEAVRGQHGCIHGWKLGISGEPEAGDLVDKIGTLRVVVDSDLSDALDGAVVDYKEDQDGIGFVIEAPNKPPPKHGHGGCNH